jgi:hypothetical protein
LPAPDEPDFDAAWDGPSPEDEVPRDFYSEYLSAPFIHCIDCEAEVQSTGEAYSIVKSYVGQEAVFEMAICARCSIRLAESYSSHSKAVIEGAIREWKHPQGRETDSPGARASSPIVAGKIEELNHCAGCGRSRTECRRYSIVGAFLGQSLVSPTETSVRLPLLICDACNSSATENISKQTRDNWDRFVEDHFDGPPGVEEDAPRFDPVLI